MLCGYMEDTHVFVTSETQVLFAFGEAQLKGQSVVVSDGFEYGQLPSIVLLVRPWVDQSQDAGLLHSTGYVFDRFSVFVDRATSLEKGVATLKVVE